MNDNQSPKPSFDLNPSQVAFVDVVQEELLMDKYSHVFQGVELRVALDLPRTSYDILLRVTCNETKGLEVLTEMVTQDGVKWRLVKKPAPLA